MTREQWDRLSVGDILYSTDSNVVRPASMPILKVTEIGKDEDRTPDSQHGIPHICHKICDVRWNGVSTGEMILGEGKTFSNVGNIIIISALQVWREELIVSRIGSIE